MKLVPEYVFGHLLNVFVIFVAHVVATSEELLLLVGN